VYLKAYADAGEARHNLGSYFVFYNTERPHQPLGYRIPAEVYYSNQVETFNGGMVESTKPVRVFGHHLRIAGPRLNLE
jgi:hypothetical protein